MKLISHRGTNKIYNENTFNSINYCFNLENCLGVEFDVRITSDKKLVICHDYFIDRVSNGSGILNEIKYDDLKLINFGKEKFFEKIPLLTEILNIKTKKIFLIELKLNKKEFNSVKKKLYYILKKYSYKKLYIFSSNYEINDEIKEMNLNILVGELTLKNIKNKKLDFYLIYHLLYDEKKYKNKCVFLYTVNNIEDIKTNTYYIVDHIDKI